MLSVALFERKINDFTSQVVNLKSPASLTGFALWIWLACTGLLVVLRPSTVTSSYKFPVDDSLQHGTVDELPSCIE